MREEEALQAESIVIHMSDSAFLESLGALSVVANEMLEMVPHSVDTGPFLRWERSGPGMAMSSPQPSAFPLVNLGLTKTPEFQVCEEAMRADPLIGHSVDQLVGSVLSASALKAPIAIIQLLGQSIIDGQVSTVALERELEQLREYFLSQTVERRFFVGVFGVRIIDEQIDLPGGVRLRSMGSNDIESLIQTGVGETSELGLFFPGEHRTVAGLPDMIAEVRYQIPVWRPEDIDLPHFDRSVLPDMHRIGEQVLTTLALLTNAPVARTGVIVEDLHWFNNGRSWSAHPQRTAVSAAVAQLGQSDVERLVEVYEQLASEGVTNRKNLELALRRFVLALSRTRDDDRLIDLVIAGEALLLKKRSKLLLQLAQRAAALAEGTTLSPREVFDRMRDAYRVRSNVVHGEDVAADKLKTTRIELEADLRVLLTAYVRMASEMGGSVPLTLDEARYLPDTTNSD